ncbi:unnamed protein product [Jaminaea pallidilutea]
MQGPFVGGALTKDKLVFNDVKPICVQILALARPGPGIKSAAVGQQLGQLRAVLSSHITPQQLTSPGASCYVEDDAAEQPLGASVLHYIFFPVSQLFRATPKGPADLPDRARQEAFSCLGLLCQEWWHRWTTVGSAPSSSTSSPAGAEEALQMWKQLMILGAITLSGSGPKSATSLAPQDPNSEYTKLAVLKFLYSLLAPRRRKQSRRRKAQTSTEEWEWDGESDLTFPSEVEGESVSGIKSRSSGQEDQTMYPTRAHLRMAAQPNIRSPLLHTLTSSLDVLAQTSSHSTTTELRSTAIEVVRCIATIWLPANAAPAERAKSLAPVLPGVVSKVVRILTINADTGTPIKPAAVPGEIVARSLSLVESVVIPVLSASVNEDGEHNESKEASLENFTTVAHLLSKESQSDDQKHAQASEKVQETSRPPDKLLQNLTLALNALDAETGPSKAGREDVDGVSSHSNPSAQKAVISLAASLLIRCGKALHTDEYIDQKPVPLQILLTQWLLAQAPADDMQSQTLVERMSTASLREIVRKRGPDFSEVVHQIGRQSLQQLLDAVPRHLNTRIAAAAHRVAAIAAMLSAGEHLDSPTVAVALTEGIGRWGPRLTEALVLSNQITHERIDTDAVVSPPFAHIERWAGHRVVQMLRAWGKLAAQAVLGQAQTGSSSVSAALQLPYWFLEESRRQRFAARALRADVSSIEVVALSTSALSIAHQILHGVSLVLGDAKLAVETGKAGSRARKAARKVANDLVQEVMDIWEEESQALTDATPTSSASVPGDNDSKDSQASKGNVDKQQEQREMVEHVKGLPVPSSPAQSSGSMNFGPALDLSFVRAATVPSLARTPGATTQQQQSTTLSAQHQWAQTLQLDLLSIAARLLGSRLQARVPSLLYPLISALTHPSGLVSEAARRCLVSVAHSTGSADTVTLVRMNVDAILGEASWRLVVGLGKELAAVSTQRQRLALHAVNQVNQSHGDDLALMNMRMADSHSTAHPLLSARNPPMVLTEVMRLLGPSSLHLIEDSIDEVLDALDRYHADGDVADALLSVLDRLLVVMAEEAVLQGDANVQGPDPADSKRTAGVKSTDDFSLLDEWLSKREKGTLLRPPVDDIPAAFDQTEQQGKPDSEDVNPNAPPTPASRSQSLLVAILTKAMPFLSHGSPVIRARVLRLFAGGTRLLAPNEDGGSSRSKWTRREDEILPLVNQAWPLIMARLGWSVNRPLPSAGSRATPKRNDLTEPETSVHLEALRLLQTLAVHVADFVAKRIVDEAWPRIRLILAVEEHESGLGYTSSAQASRNEPKSTLLLGSGRVTPSFRSSDGPSSKAVVPTAHFKPFAPHTLVYDLVLSSLLMLRPLMSHQGLAFPDQALWEVLTLPLYVQALDGRQKTEIRQAARSVLQATYRCDGGATAWVVLRLLNGGRGEQLVTSKWRDLLSFPGSTSSLDVSTTVAEVFRTQSTLS